MLKKLIIIGIRGNGTVVASTVEDINAVNPEWELIGFLDDAENDPVHGYPVLGPITQKSVTHYLKDDNVYFYWSLISLNLREQFLPRLNRLQIPKERFATIVHPSAVVSRFARLKHGVSIQPFVNVGPNAVLGNHVQVFAQAMIGHDAHLDDYAYVANNASVGAYVTLREGAYLGTNAAVRENVELGKWSLTGMGSVVVKSVPPNETWVGNPARKLVK